MHLLLMTFGNNERHHLQACFCVYSFLAKNARLSSINIMTDRPEFYKNIENKLNVIPVTAATLKEWKGSYDYFWRIKIKAIGQLCSEHPGEPVIYLDTDTFLYHDFEAAHRIVASGHAGMHRNEAPLNAIPTRTARRMYEKLKGRPLGNITDLSAFNMWNAGVIITPNTNDLAEITLALEICDEMSRLDVPEHFIEQFSVSIAMHQVYQLQPAESFLAHYWSNKDEWNQLISVFFQRCYLEALSQQQTMERFSTLALGSIPVNRKIKRMKTKLQKTVDRLFPDRNLEYVSPAE
ncbi:MAG: hypothetical protein EOO05_01805 [Chitinophagaceae bacterium]|nr:MAG: hypothetical protein EOO05_01805 [Chitinophagaceae bacterium]